MMDFFNGDKPWAKSEKITAVGKCHRIFGYIMLFFGNLACALGTENYVKYFMHRPDLVPMCFISLITFCVIVLILETVHRIVRRRSTMRLRTPVAGTKVRERTIKFYTPH